MGENEKNSVRRKIVAGARRHFLANGFRGVTMDDLASELRMSKKTLYQHFPGKAALLEAVVFAKLGEAESELAAISSKKDRSFSEGLREMLACIRRQAAELSPAFLRDMDRDAGDLFAKVQVRRRKLIHGHWKELFERGRKERVIRRDLSLDLMISALEGAADAVVNPSRLEQLNLSAREAFTQVISLYVEGSAAGKGRTLL